ncbi:hypothetical protein QTP86_018637, partial [Hemibagrus guttatus]
IVFLLFTYLTLRCCSICPRNWLFADIPSLAQQSMIFRIEDYVDYVGTAKFTSKLDLLKAGSVIG